MTYKPSKAQNLIEVSLEDLMVHEDPVVLGADVGPQNARGNLPVVDGRPDLADIM